MTEKTYSVEYTLAANLAARSRTQASIRPDPAMASVTVLTVPKGKRLIIKDIYIDSAPTTDIVAEIYKNRDTRVLITDPMSGLIATNPAKPKYKPLVFDEHETLHIYVVNLAAVGASDESDVFYMKVEEVPIGKAPSGGGWVSKLKIS